MWDDLFSSIDYIEKGINAAWLRNEVIGNNIANVDTPGFKTSEVEFEDIMTAAVGGGDGKINLTVTDENHISAQAGSAREVKARVMTNRSTSAGLDENNVDIENEMVELAKNSIAYYALVNKANSEFRKLSAAIDVT